MQIGIIGAGNIGATLARLCRTAGHDVMIANSRGPETLADAAATLDVRAVDVHEAVTAQDFVILSVPQPAVARLAPGLFSALPAGSAVIDTGNYYPLARDGAIPAIDDGLLDSMWVAEQIRQPVLKVFNSIGARSLATGSRPAGAVDRIALAVSGDDTAAKQKLIDLLDQIGFDGVDAGALAESWRQQPGTLGYCHDYATLTLRAALNAANPAHVQHCRAEGDAFAVQLIALHTGAGKA
jgi:predicted dinucleotide-binding enzyme